MQGYSSKDRRVSLFDGWDLSESVSAEPSEEVRQLKDKIRALTEELEKTKADNVKLYGKIRYVQDYNHEKVVLRGSKRSGEDLESGDVGSKYKKMYEKDINPFAAFSKKVSDQSSGNNLDGQSGAPSTSNSQVN